MCYPKHALSSLVFHLRVSHPVSCFFQPYNIYITVFIPPAVLQKFLFWFSTNLSSVKHVLYWNTNQQESWHVENLLAQDLITSKVVVRAEEVDAEVSKLEQMAQTIEVSTWSFGYLGLPRLVLLVLSLQNIFLPIWSTTFTTWIDKQLGRLTTNQEEWTIQNDREK